MVRLQRKIPKKLWEKFNSVSIPLWFDYNGSMLRFVHLLLTKCLNSTMVRLQLETVISTLTLKVGLNSTMVRLQQIKKCIFWN